MGVEIAASALEVEIERANRYRVPVAEYLHFRRNGFLVVRGLVSLDEVEELRRHTEDLMQGRLPEQLAKMSERDTSKDGGVSIQDLQAPPEDLSPLEKAQYFLRVHMLHRRLEIHERYLLHPRVLDVMECLIGPDVLAMQTMLFLKPPGKPGQGWHQDSCYIPTHPDTLCGAWIAIDECDEKNGAMWFAKRSNVEPIYPPPNPRGFGTRELGDIPIIEGASNPNDAENGLSQIADKYDQVLVSAKPGDVVFFGGHVLHRSKQNWSTDRFRRSFVSHYCNARSFTQWGADTDADGNQLKAPVTGGSNLIHILARGDTHLPYALPRFGTPCAALLTPEERRKHSEYVQSMMADMGSGMMGAEPADPNPEDNHDAPAADSYSY